MNTKKYKRKMNKKLLASIVVLVFVSMASIAGIVTVLALSSKTIDSAMFVRFHAIDIDGEVEAAYRIGNADSWTSMSGDKPHVFDATDEENNAQMNPGNISLSSSNNFVEFRYTFRNFGDADYTGLLTLDEVVTENNMKIEYKYNDEEYSTSSYGLVVEGVDTASADKIKTRGEEKYTEMTYYVKVSVAELSKSANYSSDFFWLLERYDGEVTGQVIPLATSTYTANGDGTYSASYNGSNISTASTSAGTPGVSNVWIVPNNLGSAAITKVVKGDDLPANTKVVLGDNVTTIESGTFSLYNSESGEGEGSSGLVEIVIGKGITEIPDGSFGMCSNLRNVTIGPNVTSMGNSAYFGCTSLTNIEIPASVTSIGNRAFYHCRELTSIVIPDGVTSLSDQVLADCSGLTSIEIPNSVTSIGAYALSDTGLTSVVIPESVTSIGYSAFYSCEGLKEITIPSSVTSIGRDAFIDCYKLVEIYDLRTTQMSAGNYGTLSDARILRAGDSSVIHTDSNGIQYFEYETGKYKIFGYVGTNTEVIIPSTYNGGTVTEIRQYAFYYNKNITKVTISEGITSIGDSAFYYCSGLTSVVIPDRVTSIGNGAFRYCSGLTSVVIPDSVTSIGNGAFRYSGLISVEFKNTTGWFVADSADATSGTTLTISATDFRANTTLLISTYYSKYWKRG